MEEKRYGGKSVSREEALELVLREFSKDILNQKEPCDRAFRISETWDKNIMCYKDDEYTFKINEIKVYETQFVCHADEVIFNPPRKYNFKERIKILFKGVI